MAKKETAAQVNKGAGKVAAAIAKVYGIVAQNGNVITQCVTSAMSVYKGADIPKRDLSAIADKVAMLRKWTPASSGPRKSEVRKILRVYPRLPEAITAYARKHDSFTWHTAVKLARCLGREPALNKALALMDSGPAKPEASPLVLCGRACKRLISVNSTGGSKARKFQDAVQDIAEQMDIPNVF